MEFHELESNESKQPSTDIYEIIKEDISQFKSNKENEQKANYFYQFLLKFHYLLINSINLDLRKETVFILYNFIFENIDYALYSNQSSLETAAVISNANQKFISNESINLTPNGNSNIKISTYSIKMILKKCCYSCSDSPNIYKTFTPFLSSLFSKEDFFLGLAKSDIFEFILSDILFLTPNHDYDIFLFDICFVFPKPSFFASILINSFTTFFVNSVNENSIQDNSREITAKFVATLVSKVASVSKGAIDLFGQFGGFLAYDKLISKFPEKERPNYYSIFMISDCEPSIIDHLLTLYQSNPNDEQTYFEMFSQKLRTQSELIQGCQIEKWFEMNEPKMNHLIPLFKFIYQNSPSLSASSLPYLLKSMSKIEIYFNTADEVLKITLNLLNQNFLTLEQLTKMNFLDVFFFNTTKPAFLEMVSIQHYFQLFISIYNFLNESKQITFFSKFCKFITTIEKDKFITICSSFLIRSSIVENMKTLLDTLDQCKDCSYISILLNSFVDSGTSSRYVSEVGHESSYDSMADVESMSDLSLDIINCQRNFILAGGIDWIFNSNFLTIESTVSLISHLVSCRCYEQLENKIDSLDHSKHPLFSVDSKSMLKMVFGMVDVDEVDFYYHPIRIRGLFEFLKEKFDVLNPYNIFYLGKEFIDSKLNENNDIYSVPYIHSFGNRCITQEHIPSLFKCPEKLIDFCDKSQDHFSFYMLFQDNFPLIFNASLSPSSGLSFWFKIEQKNDEQDKMALLCQTDNGIKFFAHQKKIIIHIDTFKSNDVVTDTIETDFDPTLWNHVFINVYSQYSLGSNFLIAINSKNVSPKIKRKLNQISTIFFFNQNQNTILYISYSIRIFYNYQKDANLLNVIYSRGPLSFFNNENSEIISPITKINYYFQGINKKPVMKKKYETEKVTKYCYNFDVYLVPYLGFPKHPISHEMLFTKIKECESLELYEILIKTFLEMAEINPVVLYNYDLLSLLKNSKQKPSYSIFTNILQKQINLFGARKDFLTELIFDSSLWTIFDPVFVFKALFELFPINIWSSDRMLVTFIAHSLLTNSDKPDVATIAVKHLVEIPSLMKYVASLIKVAPVLSRLNPVWNQIEFRENSFTQEVLINSLIPIINKDNYNFFKSYLPFNELKSLFIVSSDLLCSSIFALITQFSIVQMSINNKENDYFEFDFVFFSKFVQLSHIKKVWESAFEMHHLPSLLSLIWSSSIAFTYFYSNIGSMDIDQFNSYPFNTTDSTQSDSQQNLQIEKLIKEDINIVMNNAINYCVDSSTKIMNDPICLKIISFFYPHIFTYPSLFKNFQNLNDVTQADPIVLNVNQFSDIDDDLWIEKMYVLSRFNFPPSTSPFSYFSFLNQMISSVLRNFGFSLPFSFKSSSNILQSSSSPSSYHDPNETSSFDLVSWFSQSPLLDLFMSIISNCSCSFLDSFLYSIVSNDHNNPLLSTLIHGLLSRIPTNSIEKVLVILDNVSVLSSFQLLNQNAIILMADLFTLFNIVQTKFNDREACVVASRIQPVLISLLNSIPFSEIKMLFSLLTNNLKAFKFFIETTHSLHSWLYSFIAFSHNEIEVYNDFITKLKQVTQLDENDQSIIDKISRRQIQNSVNDLKEIESEWKDLSNNFRSFAQSQFHKIQDEKNKNNKEIKQISADSNYFKYYTDVKHFLLSFFVCQNIRYFEVYSSLYKETLEWTSLMKKIKNELFEFKPKYRLRSNFFWPYQAKHSDTKSIMIQSIFNDLIFERNKIQTVKSEVIKTFKKTIKFQYVFINDIPLNLFNLFKDNYGNPDNYTNCTMILKKHEIPCVLFLYEKKILIVTYASIKPMPSKTILPGSSMPASTPTFSISGENNFFFKKEKDTFELNCFYQYAFSGNFGPIKLFASHILITINLDSIIAIQWIDKLRFKLWSLLCGFFEFQLSQKVNIKYKETFAFNPSPSKEELLQQWTYRQISTNDLFERLNQMSNSENEAFQLPAPEGDVNEIDYNLIKEKLSPYFTENFLSKSYAFQRNKAEPLFYAPYSTLVDFIPRSSLYRLYSQFFPSFAPRGQNTIEISMKKISCSCLFFIVEVDVIKSTISIKENDFSQSTTVPNVFIKKYKNKFQSATHVSVSSNGVFVGIDYLFGLTEIYRVLNKKKSSYLSLSTVQKGSYCATTIPMKIKKIIQFSKETLFRNFFNINNNIFNNYSLISERDLISICFYDKRIIMLNLINGFAINQIEMPSKITAIAIDEYNSSIIVAMEKNGIQVIKNSFLSQNDSSIEQHPISFSLFNKDVVTAMGVVQNQNEEIMRTVICGTDSGKILLLYYDDKGVDIRPLYSRHSRRITRIEIDPEKRFFISVDAGNIAFVWSKSKTDQYVIKFDN